MRDSMLSLDRLRALPRPQRLAALELLEEKSRRAEQRRFYRLFPDETQYNPDGSIVELSDGTRLYGRELYPQHLDFLRGGAKYRERALMAANRVGKTELAAYEVTAHLTGDYPHWWEGRRFSRPIRAWACGKSFETTRDIVQAKLLGEVVGSGSGKAVSGTGMVPGRRLGRPTWKSGVPNLVDTIGVRHASGGWSLLGYKAYEQGRQSFEGTSAHVVWDDEEPPIDVYGEQLTRTATTGGIMLMTLTPLQGRTATVLQFQPGYQGDKH